MYRDSSKKIPLLSNLYYATTNLIPKGSHLVDILQLTQKLAHVLHLENNLKGAANQWSTYIMTSSCFHYMDFFVTGQ